MTPVEKATVRHYHKHRFQQVDYTMAQKQGWTNEEVQQLRFEAITKLADFNDKSVLDVGCGAGDFKELLDQQFKRFDYIGIDQQPEFISHAKEKFANQQGVWFYEADMATCKLPQVDIVVASGLLSYASTQSDYFLKMIERLYAAADNTLIFNMLNDQVFESTELIVAHDKEKMVEFCNTLSDVVVVKDDYLEIDFTVCMKKKNRF
jgi:trans-aconitate methyltransferase